MSLPRILAFSGSTRVGSFNQQLVSIVAEGARVAGASLTVISLRDFPLPLFDQDLEAAVGLPDNARKLKALMLAHHGFLIASPEYNSSVSGVLKNAIDWVSRAESDTETPLIAFRGKVAAILSASPGRLGGIRGLVHLRSILGNIGMLLLPEQVTISRAHEAFDGEGALKDARKRQQVTGLGASLVKLLGQLAVT